MNRSAACMMTLLTTALIGGGCSQNVSVQSWKSSLETHLADQTNGDMSFVRSAAADGRPQFSLVSDRWPDKSTDATGVLVGRSDIRGTPSSVFILGLSKRQTLEDVRVVVVPDQTPRDKWLMSREDDAALSTYTRHHAAQWRKHFGQREQVPSPATQFPRESDQFTMQQSGNTLSVVETGSSARWTLVLPGQAQAN